MKKKLYRSRDDVLVAGVLSGMAEYFDHHDPTLWRLAFIVFLIATGVMPGVLIYLGAWLVIPQKPPFEYTDVTPDADETEQKEDVNKA